MGYRKAAMMHRYQRVRGHYRTSRSGKTYWVQGHDRNGPPPSPFGALYAIAFTLGLFVVPLLLASIPRAFQEEIEFRQREAAELQRSNLDLPK